jgi:hypothetical protein
MAGGVNKLNGVKDFHLQNGGCGKPKGTTPKGAAKQKILHLQDACVEALHFDSEPLARALCAGQRPTVGFGVWVLGGVGCKVYGVGFCVWGW